MGIFKKEKQLDTRYAGNASTTSEGDPTCSGDQTSHNSVVNDHTLQGDQHQRYEENENGMSRTQMERQNNDELQGLNNARTGSTEYPSGSTPEPPIGAQPMNSQALHHRGLQKEREAVALRRQAQELNAAERLEEQAQAFRDRAVQGGAHPAHRTLGGPGGL